MFRTIKNKKIKVAVVGDIGVDVYYYGKVKRISPEFPVPILHSTSHQPHYFPACAANVAYQLDHFNTEVSLFGFMDETFLRDLPWLKFNTEGCVRQGQTPRKIRFYDDDYPMLRWDIEQENYGETDLNRDRIFINWLDQVNSKGFDVVILSNYGKGVFDDNLCRKLIRECQERKILTVTDPKNNVNWWTDCNVFKPNAVEALAMTGLKDWRTQCDMLRQMTGCKSVVITQAGSGIVGKTYGGYFEYAPQKTIKEVNSVIGAGDAFISILSLLLAHQMPVDKAAGIAFEAGAEYVKTKHNRPITPYELYRRLDPVEAKIVNLDELLDIKKCYEGQKFIFTNGCWDILHLSHLNLLNHAKSLGDKLIVAINTDESVQKLKGDDRPINKLEDRMRVLANLECVDFIIPFAEGTPLQLIQNIRPFAIVKGGDYQKQDVIGHDVVGLENVHIFPYKEGYSTTHIVNKIRLAAGATAASGA